MLTIRQRGRYWHCYGTVKQGQKKKRFREHSTGETEKRLAERYRDNLEAEAIAQLTLGIEAPKPDDKLPFSEAVSRYVDKIMPKAGDRWRLERLLDFFEDKPLDEINAADWERFCRERLGGVKPNTIARYHVTFRGVFTHVGEATPFPQGIKAGGKRVEIARWLPLDVADRLIEAYAYKDQEHGRHSAQAPHAKQIALFLRFQGARTQETLQLQRSHFDLARGAYGSVFIAPSKNGESRWLPLHPRVREAVEPLLAERRATVFLVDGKPRDPLFLTDKRKPYTDTRSSGIGGNPFRRSHVSACKRAGVSEFRVHDWRHHWATWCVKTGMDLRTLQVLGGWKELSMVQRYAAVDMDHAGDQLRRLK